MSKKKYDLLNENNFTSAFFYDFAKSKNEDRKASSSGNFFEYVVRYLTKLNFKIFDAGNMPEELPNRFIITNAPYKDLPQQWCEKSGHMDSTFHTSKSEFVIFASDANKTPEFPDVVDGLEIRVECKYQHRSGSVSDKLIKSFLDMKFAIPEKNGLILFEGSGFKKSVLAYICENGIEEISVRNKKPKNVQTMFGVKQFFDFVNRAFA